jgi:predicted cupin superfamily sugar epimerase
MINDKGKYSAVRLGSNPEKGDVFQFTIPHGTWFASVVDEPDSFALVGCTVAPGFHFDDFELGKREELIKLLPGCKDMIEKFTSE